MAKLFHKKKEILSEMNIATSTWQISKGLMFASKSKSRKGMCLVMPVEKDVKFGASVTMMFCFHSLEILFVDSKFKVVDKVVLRPWKFNYTPKKACKYVIESLPGTFKEIGVGDRIELISE